jgi:hypothetical protein
VEKYGNMLYGGHKVAEMLPPGLGMLGASGAACPATTLVRLVSFGGISSGIMLVLTAV